MKLTLKLLIITTFLALTACKDTKKIDEQQAAEATVKEIESVEMEIDGVVKEIEEKGEELESSLSELDEI